MNTTVVSIVVIYLLAMHGIAYWVSRRIESNEDFMVAGRRLGPFMLAGTLAATEVGGGSSLGVTEKAYGSWGMSAIWYVLAMGITFVLLSFIAPKLRQSMVKTVPEYFRKRYGPANGGVTALIMIFPMIGLTAIQLMASATILSVMTGFSYSWSAVIVTVLVTEYSVLGGLWSVTVTDAVQWVLVVVGTALVIPYALDAAGGWETVVATVPASKLSLTEGMGWPTIIAITLMYFTSFAVGQEAVQRYYAAKDERAARLGSIIAAVFYALYAFIPAVLGIIAYSMVQTGALDPTLIEANGARYVLPTMASQVLPPILVGGLFAALISATMSSADSDLLAAGSIFSNDIYRIYINPNATDAQVLKVTRWTMVAVGFLSLLVALMNWKDMVTVLMFSFALRAGGEFIPYVIGHYWKKATPAASLSSIVAGCATVIYVQNYKLPYLDFTGVDAIAGVCVNAIVFFTVSTLAPADEKKSSFGLNY
ncbi:MAG: sodium:solute symporter family protein [Candidatus Lindowbacteria bacterium]|nr:sodium:solute symporter family protein [Candidatus Lindowbacteria bacterium]